MDERTLASAARAQDQFEEAARARAGSTNTYTVIVMRRGKPEKHTVKASGAQQRAEEMKKLGIDVSRSHWAAGYRDGKGELQICGNSPEAEKLVRAKLGGR